MIRKNEVIEFFDRLAPAWDDGLERSDEIIRIILDNAGVGAKMDVLDVATGTGVLIPDYLSRGVASVTGIDLSPEMVRIAREKFPQPQVEIVCGDAEEMRFGRLFDCIVVYNAFPHFPDPRRLIQSLSSQLKPGGTLTVAHGKSREEIDSHHRGHASRVSLGLMPARKLSALFSDFLCVTHVISDERMYQVTGKREA